MAITVRKAKNGQNKYQVRVRDHEDNCYPTKTFDRKSDAERYERELETKKDKGQEPPGAASRRKLVDHFFTEWFAYREMKVSRGWITSLRRRYELYVKYQIGHLPLRDIKPPMIGLIIGQASKKGLLPQSVLHIYNLLNQGFKDAVEYYGYLDRSPVLKQDRPVIHRTEREYLTPEQSWRLLDACKGHYLAPGIWLGVLSGLRISEIQALQWRAVDFEKGQILICAAYKRGSNKIEPYPKQKDWALVPMPQVLAEFLKTTSRHRFPASYVAPAACGGMLEYKKFFNGLRQLCKKAGVKQVSPHELRHSCTEIWFRSGATLEDIRRLLNHKTTETTQRYVHRTDDRLLSLAKAITAPSAINA